METSFEQKIALLVLAKNPKEKAELIQKFSNNTEFFTGFNARTMPFEQYMKLNAAKFAVVAKRAKLARDNMKNKGWTDKKYQKYLAELPEDLFLERPEFNSHQPQKVLDRNIQNFLIKYPEFRVDK